MSNDYFNNTTYTVTDGEVAEATDIEGKLNAVAAGFDMLPSDVRTKNGSVQWVDDTGTANTCVVTMNYPRTAYADGMYVVFRVNVTNTGATTLNVDGLGAKAIRNIDGSALSASTLVAGRIAEVRYDDDNGYFILVHATATINVNTGFFGWEVITANTTAEAGHGYICDTSAGTFTLTLPASPSVGDSVAIKDGADFSAVPLTVARNSLNIMSLGEDMTIPFKNISLELTYASVAKGWRI